jgi:hypothetical protein
MPNARLNSNEERKRADALQARLQKRMEDLKLEAKLSALPPVVLGGLLVVPAGLLASIGGKPQEALPASKDTQAAAARARAIVMEVERNWVLTRSIATDKLGRDIESRVRHRQAALHRGEGARQRSGDDYRHQEDLPH